VRDGSGVHAFNRKSLFLIFAHIAVIAQVSTQQLPPVRFNSGWRDVRRDFPSGSSTKRRCCMAGVWIVKPGISTSIVPKKIYRFDGLGPFVSTRDAPFQLKARPLQELLRHQLSFQRDGTVQNQGCCCFTSTGSVS